VYGFADQKSQLDSAIVGKVLKDKHAAVANPSKTAQDGAYPFDRPSSMGSGQHQPGTNSRGQRITNLNSDSARLLFKKYYNEK
jgi:hypothetical protein